MDGHDYFMCIAAIKGNVYDAITACHSKAMVRILHSVYI